MQYPLIIFDFDGTLADSFPFFIRVHNTLAKRHGFARIGAGELDELRRLTQQDVMRRLGAPIWKLPRIAADFISLMRKEAANISLFDGVADALRFLHERGASTAILTSNSHENVSSILGADLMRCVQHVECGAPMLGKRRRLERVIRKAGVACREAIYIGDQHSDAESARAAGVAFGAVCWGYAEPESLRALEPTMVFDSVAQLRLLAGDA